MRALIVLMIGVMWAGVLHAGGFQRADAPSWVDMMPLPAPDPAQFQDASNGIYYLIIDRQIVWEGEQRLFFQRFAMKILNRSGLEDVASVIRTFDPAYETMTLTHLDVIRDGDRQARRDSVSPRVFQRETDLDKGIIDGTQTMHIDLAGIRVGDTIDVGVLWEGAPRVPGSGFQTGVQLGYGVPVQALRFRMDWPAERPISLKEDLRGVTAQVQDMGDIRRYEWRQDSPRIFDYEDRTATGYATYPYVEVSAYGDWAEVAQSLAPYYTADYQLSDDWEARAREIEADNPTTEGRIIAALRAVQQDIRYVGVEIGDGGFYARTPQQVAAYEFGDCKDKSLLLKTVLLRLGVSADVALARLNSGHHLNTELPGPFHFNHMIVGAHHNGDTYWMDPTGSFEGGTLDVAAEPDYGYVLPLTKGHAELTHVHAPSQMGSVIEVAETFQFSFIGVKLQVQSTYQGEGANWMRSKWARNPARDIQNDYLEYYAGRYPGLRVLQPMTMKDDRDGNKITVSEFYFLPPTDLNRDALIHDFPFGSEDYVDEFPNALIAPRQASMRVNHRVSRRHVVEVRNAPINFDPPETVVLKNPAFSYRFESTAERDGHMRMTWSYDSLAHSVPADAVDQVIRDARKVDDVDYWTWDLTPGEDTE